MENRRKSASPISIARAATIEGHEMIGQEMIGREMIGRERIGAIVRRAPVATATGGRRADQDDNSFI